MGAHCELWKFWGECWKGCLVYPQRQHSYKSAITRLNTNLPDNCQRLSLGVRDRSWKKWPLYPGVCHCGLDGLPRSTWWRCDRKITLFPMVDWITLQRSWPSPGNYLFSVYFVEGRKESIGTKTGREVMSPFHFIYPWLFSLKISTLSFQSTSYWKIICLIDPRKSNTTFLNKVRRFEEIILDKLWFTYH